MTGELPRGSFMVSVSSTWLLKLKTGGILHSWRLRSSTTPEARMSCPIWISLVTHAPMIVVRPSIVILNFISPTKCRGSPFKMNAPFYTLDVRVTSEDPEQNNILQLEDGEQGDVR